MLLVGKPVMIVNGAYRGLRAVMERLNEKSFSVTVKIDQVCTRRGIVSECELILIEPLIPSS